MALSYPDKKFTLISDDKVLLNTDGSGNLLKVIKEIYGSEVARKMRKISVFNDDYDVDGFISLPEVTRSSRNLWRSSSADELLVIMRKIPRL